MKALTLLAVLFASSASFARDVDMTCAQAREVAARYKYIEIHSNKGSEWIYLWTDYTYNCSGMRPVYISTTDKAHCKIGCESDQAPPDRD